LWKKRTKKNKDEKIDDSWLLPYADMLTLLLALFIVLFAMSEIDIKKFEQLSFIFQSEFTSGAGVIDQGINIVPEDEPLNLDKQDDKEKENNDEEEENKEAENEVEESELDRLRREEHEELRSIQEELEEYIAKNSLTEEVGTKLTGEGLLITMRTDITFDSGKADVKEEGREIGLKISDFLNMDPPKEIIVSGHADDVPMQNEEFASNWELSTMRAVQFMYILLEGSDIDPKWFSARGFSEYRPLVPNDSAENRAINRRVEVLIQPNYKSGEEET